LFDLRALLEDVRDRLLRGERHDDALRKLEIGHRDVSAEVEVRDVDLDLRRDAIRGAAHRERAERSAELAALLHAERAALGPERPLDVDLLVERHAVEVRVDRLAGHRMDRDLANHRVLRATAERELDERVPPLLTAKSLLEVLRGDRQRRG